VPTTRYLLPLAGAPPVSRSDCFTPTVQAGRFSWSDTNANTTSTGLSMITDAKID
jgi:hypothetical protein